MERARRAATTTKERGDAQEALAWAHLREAGLALVARNYRVAQGPNARGAEIDLIVRERDGTLVFVEVRSRSNGRHGSAAESIGAVKRSRIVHAARRYLLGLRVVPPCRFDVVAIDGGRIEWIKAAFEAS